MPKRKAAPEIIPPMSDEEIDAIEANMKATKALSGSDLGSLFAQARAFNELKRMYDAELAQHAALVAAGPIPDIVRARHVVGAGKGCVRCLHGGPCDARDAIAAFDALLVVARPVDDLFQQHRMDGEHFGDAWMDVLMPLHMALAVQPAASGDVAGEGQS